VTSVKYLPTEQKNAVYLPKITVQTFWVRCAASLWGNEKCIKFLN